MNDFYDSEVYLQMPGANLLEPVWPGAYHEPIMELDVGTYEINIYTRFGDKDVLPHDWSLVAWSEKSQVKISHKGGFENRQFRNLESDPSIQVPRNFSPPDETEEEDSGI